MITVTFTADQFQRVTSESSAFREIIGADSKDKLEKAFVSAITPEKGAENMSILQKMEIIISLNRHNKIAAIKYFRQIFNTAEKEAIFKVHCNFHRDMKDDKNYLEYGVHGLYVAKMFIENYLEKF